MGQSCANKCNCKDKDNETEAFTDLGKRQAYPAPPKTKRPVPNPKKETAKAGLTEDRSFRDNSPVDYSKRNAFEKYAKYLKQIIKLQARYRGYLSRKKLPAEIRSKINASSSRYAGKMTKQVKRGGIIEERTYADGAKYKGDVRNGMREGRGVQEWPNGGRYEGEWKNDKSWGKGKFIHACGDEYEGEWANDKANGKGTFKRTDGWSYTGDWKDDQQHGHGVETAADGSRYEGQFIAGMKQGKGKYEWNDGTKYDGDWVKNVMEGKGKYTWSDGRTYTGSWKDNKMHGKGVYSWPNGKKYIGEYRNDKKEGTGTYTWPDGREYSGAWKDGKQHGTGKFKSKSGVVKTGLWEDGKRVKWLNIVNPDGTTKRIEENDQSDDGDEVPASSVVNPSRKGKSKRKES